MPVPGHVHLYMCGSGVPTLRVQADLTSQSEVQRVVEEVTAGLGPIDVLIHNAGGDIAAGGGKADPNDAVFIAEEDWRAILENNLTSTILVCQAVAKSMIEHGTEGRIVTLSSDAGVLVNAHGSQAMVRTHIGPIVLLPFSCRLTEHSPASSVRNRQGWREPLLESSRPAASTLQHQRERNLTWVDRLRPYSCAH